MKDSVFSLIQNGCKLNGTVLPCLSSKGLWGGGIHTGFVDRESQSLLQESQHLILGSQKAIL